MADYSKDDAETRRARAEAKEMADQRKAERAYEASRTTPYAEGGHVHHSKVYGKHAAGHKLHMDHVAAMCGGGYAKGKK